MQVSISKAAEMVGVTRATLYRHIDKKGIEVKKDAQNNPKIEVAELERVYGINLQEVNDNMYDTPLPYHPEERPPASMLQRPEPVAEPQIASQAYHAQKSAVPPMKEPSGRAEVSKRVEQLEKENALLMQERQRERTQLLRQIDGLQASLRNEQENQKHLIEMLEKQKVYIDKYSTQIPEEWDIMTKTVSKIQNQHKRIILEFHQQKNRGFWARMFNK